MKAQILFAAAMVKAQGRRYPGYIFSVCHANAHSSATGDTTFYFQADLHYGADIISVQAATLPDLQTAVKTALENHFVQNLIPA